MTGALISTEIVSSEHDRLILVDAEDHEIGQLEKSSCHDGQGVLHRAFSLFAFDAAGRLLLQQRASGKRLWPGFWSNSCCSHPRAHEELRPAVIRRVVQELGLETEPEFVFKFEYHAHFGNIGAEHELCSVFLGRVHGTPVINATEIADWRWISSVELDDELEHDPDAFTPWFRLEWQRLRTEHAATLNRYGVPAAPSAGAS